MQAYRENSRIVPKKMSGHRSAIMATHEGTVKALVPETPDASLARKVLAVDQSASVLQCGNWRILHNPHSVLMVKLH